MVGQAAPLRRLQCAQRYSEALLQAVLYAVGVLHLSRFSRTDATAVEAYRVMPWPGGAGDRVDAEGQTTIGFRTGLRAAPMPRLHAASTTR